MKNIQVIDAAANCVFDIFAATDEEFAVLFPPEQDVAFIEEVYDRESPETLDMVLPRIWTRRQKKCDVQGIHGLLYFGLEHKSSFYPTRRDEDAVNPDGTLLRGRTN